VVIGEEDVYPTAALALTAILFLYTVYIFANYKKIIDKFIVLSVSVSRCKGDNSNS
jgi:hypothetical protein